MITTRIAEPYDLSRLMAFDSFPGDRIAEIVERRMLVAELDDLVVGYVAWQQGGCIGKDYVNKLVVDDEYRRRGIAQALISALNTVLSGRVFISIGARNVPALTLLQLTGWTPAGEILGLLTVGRNGDVLSSRYVAGNVNRTGVDRRRLNVSAPHVRMKDTGGALRILGTGSESLELEIRRRG